MTFNFKKILVVTGATFCIAFSFPQMASAVSCTEQGAKCSNWAKTSSDVPTDKRSAAVAKCLSEVPQCKARCKTGDKTFYGVTGIGHAIDSCG